MDTPPDPWETPFTALVGCRLPIQQAVLGGGVGGPELAAAVSEAGGLGMLCQPGRSGAATLLDRVAALTSAPFGVGFFAFDLPERTEALELAAARARVVEVFWGDPDRGVVDRVHAGGALALWQVGSRDEACMAADAGCDAVVAQGVEAGGHVRGSTPLLALVEECAAAVAVPVVAAGGIVDGRRMAAAMAAGAAAVRVGTRFVATLESAAHPDWVAALLAAGSGATVLTTAFGDGWPDAPHRVLRSAVAAAESLGAEVAGEGPGGPVPRWSSAPPLRGTTGRIDAMALYAGAGVDGIDEVLPAAEVIRRLVAEAAPVGPR